MQGWCVQSSDPRTLGINSSPKEVIPGQVVTPNLVSQLCMPDRVCVCVYVCDSSLHSQMLSSTLAKKVPVSCLDVV